MTLFKVVQLVKPILSGAHVWLSTKIQHVLHCMESDGLMEVIRVGCRKSENIIEKYIPSANVRHFIYKRSWEKLNLGRFMIRYSIFAEFLAFITQIN